MVAFLAACLTHSWAQQKPIDLQLASHYFAEMRAASARDAGHLWGRPLYGPMLFVDPETRFALPTNRIAKAGSVRKAMCLLELFRRSLV